MNPTKNSKQIGSIALYAAIGKLLLESASIEMVIHVFVRKLSGMTDEKARLIIGGMRGKELVERFKKLIKIDHPAHFDKIERCLTHLVMIDLIRDKIVHWAVYGHTKESILIMNIPTAKNIKITEFYTFSLNDLNNIINDYHLIELNIDYLLRPTYYNNISYRKKKFIRERLKETWRYKPVAPIKKKE